MLEREARGVEAAWERLSSASGMGSSFVSVVFAIFRDVIWLPLFLSVCVLVGCGWRDSVSTGSELVT